MDQKLYRFIYQTKLAGLASFVIVAGIISLFFYTADLFDTRHLPYGFTTSVELIGQLLLLIIMPAYLAMGLIYSQRKSLQFAAEAQLNGGIEFSSQIIAIPKSYLLAGAILGLAYSSMNLPGSGLEAIMSGEKQLAAITFAQIGMWTFVGFALAIRFHSAYVFSQAGKQVKIDIFEISNLKSFAKAGLADALLIMVALAITTLQSLDAQFRAHNYINAIIITLPAMAFLMVIPMNSVHKRIVATKQFELTEINKLILLAEKSLQMDHIITLERLLQRRERLLAVQTWPLDIAVFSRLLLYFIVPPLAWIGAALMEIALNDFLT